MWIIPKNLYGTSPSVQDTEGSTLDSEEFCQSAEQSLMWRSKPSLSKTWLTRLKRNDWIQHLYTRTLSHSHSKSFVDAWTSYQEASLVNLSVRQVLKDRLKTLGISSPTSSKESESADPQLSFLKMSKASSQAKQGTENPFSNMSSEAWKKWVTQQRQEYSQRKKSARHINENASLSWATPNTSDSNQAKLQILENAIQMVLLWSILNVQRKRSKFGCQWFDAIHHQFRQQSSKRIDRCNRNRDQHGRSPSRRPS